MGSVPEAGRRSGPRTARRGEILCPGYGTCRLYGTSAEDRNQHDEIAVSGVPEALAVLSCAPDPWCLFAGTIVPHDPYVVSERYLGLYDPVDVCLPASWADEMTNLAENADYSDIKRELCGRMWRSACREDDTAISPYITVSLAPYRPGEAFRQ